MRSHACDPRSWPVWQIPRRLLVAVLTVEITVVLLVVRLVADGLPGPTELWQAAAIVGLGVAQAEIAAGIERVRKQLGGPLHVDLCSVWTFAGALVLPPALAVGVAVVVHTHLWWRSWRPRVPLYKQLFSTSTVALACLAAGAVSAVARPGGGGLLGELGVVTIVLALLAYIVVNSALVAAAIMMSAPRPDVVAALGEWDDNALELATLCLGALTAIGLVVNPFLALFALPAVLLLHRAVLVRHLEQAAITDHKTGLLTAAAWHTRAERELARPAAAPSAVLVIDLDHFKEVNDRHGHIAGDSVLVAVAEGLRAEVRDQDLVGRFGGEEFVVLLAGVDVSDDGTDGSEGANVLAIAERMRAGIAGLRVEIPTPDGPLPITGLTASIGAAIHRRHGTDVGALIHAADAALYAAKRAGRNTVRLAASAAAEVLTRPEAPA
jgi:diguanylate cyclase (GGDEF)-like protein